MKQVSVQLSVELDVGDGETGYLYNYFYSNS